MASAPKFKVYDSKNQYQAACKEAEAAAAVVSLYGEGSTIKLDHRTIVWREGVDGYAGNSYDYVANHIMNQFR